MLSRVGILQRKSILLRTTHYDNLQTLHVNRVQKPNFEKKYPKAQTLWRNSTLPDNKLLPPEDNGFVRRRVEEEFVQSDIMDSTFLSEQLKGIDVGQLDGLPQYTEGGDIKLSEIDPTDESLDEQYEKDDEEGDSFEDEDDDETEDRERAVEEMKKSCFICRYKKVFKLEAMNTPLISGYLSEAGDLIPRKVTGNCMKHQRIISRLARQCKQMGLLSYKGGFKWHHAYEEGEAVAEEDKSTAIEPAESDLSSDYQHGVRRGIWEAEDPERDPKEVQDQFLSQEDLSNKTQQRLMKVKSTKDPLLEGSQGTTYGFDLLDERGVPFDFVETMAEIEMTKLTEKLQREMPAEQIEEEEHPTPTEPAENKKKEDPDGW